MDDLWKDRASGGRARVTEAVDMRTASGNGGEADMHLYCHGSVSVLLLLM